VAFWDLMSTGSHSGPLFQTMPAHMGAWSKWALGWIDPEVVEPGDATRSIRVGQASRTPVGTEDAIRVNLPPKDVQLAEPHSGENMWWSNRDQDWADARLAHSFTVPAGADVRFSWWNDYTIEDLWDYGSSRSRATPARRGRSSRSATRPGKSSRPTRTRTAAWWTTAACATASAATATAGCSTT
jgi:bacillopeptidase F (M6 metalloprotease family)